MLVRGCSCWLGFVHGSYGLFVLVRVSSCKFLLIIEIEYYNLGVCGNFHIRDC